MIAQKIKTSDILKSEKYAIRITNIKQANKLVPFFKRFDDLKMFFENDPKHAEYVGARHTMNKGFHLYFVNPDGKTILEFNDIEIDV